MEVTSMSFSFKKWKDLIFGIITLILGGLYLYFASQVKTRPKLTPAYASAKQVPMLLGILLIILSVLCIISGIKKIRSKEESGKSEAKGDVLAVTLTFAVIILYMLTLRWLGFCLSTVIFLFLQMTILAPKTKRNYLLFAIVAVVFTAIAYVAFRIGLSQLLPRGFIEELLGL